MLAIGELYRRFAEEDCGTATAGYRPIVIDLLHDEATVSGAVPSRLMGFANKLLLRIREKASKDANNIKEMLFGRCRKYLQKPFDVREPITEDPR